MHSTLTDKRRRRPALELFPFLGLFISVMGVLAFLQLLILSSGSAKITMVSTDAENWQVPYQIFCLQQGFILVPPEAPASNAFRLSQAQMERKHQIRDKRRKHRNKLHAALRYGPLDPSMLLDTDILVNKRECLRVELDHMAQFNEWARQAGVLYEEFLLIGVYPDSGFRYWELMDLLEQPEYRRIRTGLKPLDINWTLNLEDR